VDLKEANEVLSAAGHAKRLVCAGHDQLFDPCWIDLQQRYRSGEVGKVVHIDSIFGYNLTGPFGRVMMKDPDHWVHRLPGGLFQNNISHAVYKITEFMLDHRPRVAATWFGTPNSPPTELRVMLRGSEVTANVLFSSTALPILHVVRLYGTRASVEVDFDGRLLRWSHPCGAPGAFAKLQMPFRHFAEAGRSLARNLWRFIRSDLQYFAGMNRLFRAFYRAIQERGHSPTPPDDILRVTAIMDDVFATCRRERAIGHEPVENVHVGRS
jgi:predicted dehydrogenase